MKRLEAVLTGRDGEVVRWRMLAPSKASMRCYARLWFPRRLYPRMRIVRA